MKRDRTQTLLQGVLAQTTAPLRALTLWQPWAWCVAHGGKIIENRPWVPPAWLWGQQFLIHAALARNVKREREAAALIRARTGVVVPEDGDPRLLRGAIIAVATLDCVIDARRDAPLSESVARREPWWLGPVGWVLRDVRPLVPIASPGAMGLWTPEPIVLGAVERALMAR